MLVMIEEEGQVGCLTTALVYVQAEDIGTKRKKRRGCVCVCAHHAPTAADHSSAWPGFTRWSRRGDDGGAAGGAGDGVEEEEDVAEER
jgi:hypothetical protein